MKPLNLSFQNCKLFQNRLKPYREIATRTWPTQYEHVSPKNWTQPTPQEEQRKTRYGVVKPLSIVPEHVCTWFARKHFNCVWINKIDGSIVELYECKENALKVLEEWSKFYKALQDHNQSNRLGNVMCPFQQEDGAQCLHCCTISQI